MAFLILQQIKSLLYRNYILKKRKIQEKPFQACFYLLLPALIMLIITIRLLTSVSAEAKHRTFPLVKILPAVKKEMYVAPDLADVYRLIEIVKAENPDFNFSVYESQSQMDAAYASSNNKKNIVGLYFNNNNSVTSYVLRFPYDSVPNADLIDSCAESGRLRTAGCLAETYLRSGFVYIQNAIDSAIIKIVSGNNNYTTPNIFVQRFSREVEVFDAIGLKFLGSIALVILFIPFMPFLVHFVVYEKESKLRKGMQMMGLESLALWIAWGITYTVLLLVMTIIITFLAVPGQLYPKCHFFLIFLLCFLYGLSLIPFGFMLTPFISYAKLAGYPVAFFTFLMNVLSLLPTFIALPDGAIGVICLLSPSAFGAAIGQVLHLERIDGANFSNLWQRPTPVGIPLIMLAVDILLYFILAVYFHQVVPDEYGQKRSLIFFLLPYSWCPSKHVKPVLGRYNSEEFDMENVEPVNEELAGKEGIRIRNLTKSYVANGLCTKTTSTTAVKKFSLDIYEGQITTLHGHNGSGKTSLFNILTGLVEFTSGSAFVYGYDVSNAADMRKIRQMTGVCLQQNMLMNVLSVEEHLELFAGIKGLSKEQTKSEIDRVVSLVGLETQRHTFAKVLSASERRKLSVGIAILGDPKILILDEPAAGMDPLSRNNLWDVLRSRKEGRVTLLTTHFINETDVLADRKAIISRGRLRCVGSSVFLKKKSETAYNLRVVMKENSSHAPVSNYVKNHVTKAEMHKSIGLELDYALPLAESHKFADLFRDLERNTSELGVESFGVSMTTTEEVLLDICEKDEADDEDESDKVEIHTRDDPLLNQDVRERSLSRSSADENSSHSSVNIANEIRMDNDHSAGIDVPDGATFDPLQSDIGHRSTSTCYKAMCKRLFLAHWRNPSYWYFGFSFPVGFAIEIFAIFISNFHVEDYSSDPPIVLINPDLYNDTLLYKNSTGFSLANFTSFTNSTLVPNNLNNLMNFVQTNYMASDIFQFDSNHVTYNAIYNTKGVHSLPSILNIFSSAALSQANQSMTEIITQQKQWPQNNEHSYTIGLIFSWLVVLILSPVSFSEKEELETYTLMRVSGVRFAVHWGSSFTVDYVLYLFRVTTFLIAIKAFAFVSGGAVVALIFLLIGFGASAITTSYCISYLCNKSINRDNLISSITLALLSTIAMLLAVVEMDSESEGKMASIIGAVFIPHYTAMCGLYYIIKIELDYKGLRNTDAPPFHVYFDWSNPMVPLAILMCYVHFILSFFLLRYVSIKRGEGSFQRWRKSPSLKSSSRAVGNTPHTSLPSLKEGDYDMDDEVLKEKEKVLQLVKQDDSSQEQPAILLHDLRKEFGALQNKVAVDQLSLTVSKGQVLGLLGLNRAGKTTVMNLITAYFDPTSGRVFVSGQEVLSNLSEAFMDIGYCPQKNRLWGKLTLMEHLEIYAAIQGVKKDRVKSTIEGLVKALSMEEHVNTRAKILSVGTKRKLCLAITMLGNPQVVLLDEPSTGLGLKTKRIMWDIVNRAFRGTDRAAILATNDLREAAALCSRVAIMVQGKLKFIGSIQNLKNKLPQSYILEIKLKHDNITNEAELRNFVDQLFPGVSDPEQLSNCFVYKIAQSDVVSFSSVFLEFERAKEELGIAHYSFSQSILEEAFLQFVRKQENVEIVAED